MLDEFSSQDAVSRLRAASFDPALPVSARTHAAALADRLENGVRIVFLGPKDAGKSTLCNVILEMSQLSAASDETRHFHPDPTKAEPLGLSKDTPIIALKNCQMGHAQVVDFGGSDTPEDVRKALEVADIVLWCTQSFDAQEAAAWSGAPDRLKDHSFMVLTKADVLAEMEILKEKIHSLQGIVSEEFHSLFPVTTSQLLACLETGTPAAPEQFAASGVKALVDAVFGSVTAGQRADLDSALLFLERHGLAFDAAPEPPVRPPEPDQSMPLAFKAAHETIMARAYDLAELSFDEAIGDMSSVLDLCGTISEELVEVMQERATADPMLASWSDHFQDASDKVMLMTMENDTRSAADAVTILLQLRRDLESTLVH